MYRGEMGRGGEKWQEGEVYVDGRWEEVGYREGKTLG